MICANGEKRHIHVVAQNDSKILENIEKEVKNRQISGKPDWLTLAEKTFIELRSDAEGRRLHCFTLGCRR